MALPINIPNYILCGRISTYLWANEESKGKIFDTNIHTLNGYSELLNNVTDSVEWAYGINPNDISLIKTGQYLWSLVGKFQALALQLISGGACVSPSILTNPLSQSVSSGSNVSFIVVASGTNLSYQWRLNGTNILGATSSSYALTNVTSGNNGSYDVVITNACGQVVSTAATLVVTSSLTAYWYVTTVDPYPTINGGSDPFTYTNSITFVHNAALNFPLANADGDGSKYFVFKVPTGETTKTAWFAAAFNQGAIPDPAFRSKITIGSYDYYLTRSTFTYDPSTILILS